MATVVFFVGARAGGRVRGWGGTWVAGRCSQQGPTLLRAWSLCAALPLAAPALPWAALPCLWCSEAPGRCYARGCHSTAMCCLAVGVLRRTPGWPSPASPANLTHAYSWRVNCHAAPAPDGPADRCAGSRPVNTHGLGALAQAESQPAPAGQGSFPRAVRSSEGSMDSSRRSLDDSAQKPRLLKLALAELPTLKAPRIATTPAEVRSGAHGAPGGCQCRAGCGDDVARPHRAHACPPACTAALQAAAAVASLMHEASSSKQVWGGGGATGLLVCWGA